MVPWKACSSAIEALARSSRGTHEEVYFNGLLNPPAPPSAFDAFRVKALWKIWRLGLPAMKNAVVGGQYDFPQGLFFGGKGPSQSARIMQGSFENWVGGARDIIHIDFHSGLGNFSAYKLLLVTPPDAPESVWYYNTYGREFVEPLANAEGTAYQTAGVLGDWLARNLAERNYRFVAAEFGTYSVIRVLGALRAENRAHFYCDPGERAYQRAKTELLECFCPRNASWRVPVVERGLRIIDQSLR